MLRAVGGGYVLIRHADVPETYVSFSRLEAAFFWHRIDALARFDPNSQRDCQDRAKRQILHRGRESAVAMPLPGGLGLGIGKAKQPRVDS